VTLPTLEHIRLQRDEHDCLTATLDHAGMSVNVLSQPMWRDVATVLDQVDHDPSIRQLYFCSGKTNSFIVGANLNELDRMTSASEVESFVAAGHAMMDRIEGLRVPTIAVINGMCLGGGLEFAMACRYRIAPSGTTGWLGMPETLLGLIPGWAGTYRLPLLIGLPKALELLLTARRISSDEAVVLRLIDATAPSEEFEAFVTAFLAEHLTTSTPKPARQLPSETDWQALTAQFMLDDPLKAAREAVVRCVQAACKDGREGSLRAEREEFAPLLFSDTYKQLRQQMLNRRK
jgi:3-hydroxyacyl-CoA dehydrogenase/enoyl-CoA hydratase/3-hydroxybutyryl-CoA epimerase